MTATQNATTHPSENEALVRLRLRQVAKVKPEQIPSLLGTEQAAWLGERVSTDGERREFACDLELLVRPESRATFRKAAIVALGSPKATAAGWVVPCEWRASGLTPLFPVFVGYLRFDPTGITLDGYYAPPFGAIGYVLDRALLNIAARGTARWFLGRLATVLN